MWIPRLEGTQVAGEVSRWLGVPGAMPGTHHRTAVPWDEEPALLVAQHSQSQLKSSGTRGCFASGNRRCGAGQCHPSRGDFLQLQVVWYSSGACVTSSSHGSTLRNVPAGRNAEVAVLSSLVGDLITETPLLF